MKESFYFSHDYNTRVDVKIKNLIRVHGMAGYGIFWSIVEDLYQNENSIPLDYESVAYDLRCDVSVAKSVINDFNLFVILDGKFGSVSVQQRIDERNSRSKNAKVIASKRWDKVDAPQRIKAEDCIFYIIKVHNDNEEFVKCGLTTESVSRRYSGKMNGYKYDLIYQCDSSVENCLRLERSINDKFNSYRPTVSFAGMLECFDIADLDEIKQFAMREFELCNAGLEIRNAIKGKETKGNERKRKSVSIPPPPPIEDVIAYFKENKYTEVSARKAFDYYKASITEQKPYWSDGKGNPIKNWKMKMQSVWFKDENKETEKPAFEDRNNQRGNIRFASPIL